jgi:hypothetical protein
MTLEQEIGAALTSNAIGADELTALVARAQSGIVDADEEAKREEERIYDPELCPDPKEARAAMEDARLRSGRLQTMLTRLQRKRNAVEAAERLAAWQVEFGKLRDARKALADELAATYPQVVAKLTTSLPGSTPSGHNSQHCFLPAPLAHKGT